MRSGPNPRPTINVRMKIVFPVSIRGLTYPTAQGKNEHAVQKITRGAASSRGVGQISKVSTTQTNG